MLDHHEFVQDYMKVEFSNKDLYYILIELQTEFFVTKLVFHTYFTNKFQFSKTPDMKRNI